MPHAGKPFDEKRIHVIFQVSLVLKGAFAVFEIIAGIFAAAVPQQFIFNIVAALTQEELANDPRDLVATYLLHAAQNLSVSAQHFAALYLLSHGAIKLWLIVGLLREKLGYYPTAMIAFGLFIAYQLYRFTYTHSVFLVLITVLDLAVIILTWHEYRYLKRHLLAHRR
jgi:uncharacterized membrane protein